MHDVLCMTMVDRLEEGLHVLSGFSFSKYLVGLLADFFKEGHACDELHDEVNIHGIVVGLVVLDDVRMVKCVQRGNLIHDVVQILAKFVLVEHFNGHIDTCIVLICRQKYFAKCASSEDFCLVIYEVVLLQLMNSLLFVPLSCDKLLSILFVLLYRWLQICGSRCAIKAAHLSNLFVNNIFVKF